MSFFESEWDKDSDSEEENNTPPKGVDPEFCKKIQNMKWKIYEIIVLRPELNGPNAQNNELIQQYIHTLEAVHRFFEKAQRGGVVEKDLISFPSEVRSDHLSMANWIANYFKQNGPADTVPYQDYLRTTLRVYPFVHRTGFNEDDTDDVENI
jgi:hypothetical protein